MSYEMGHLRSSCAAPMRPPVEVLIADAGRQSSRPSSKEPMGSTSATLVDEHDIIAMQILAANAAQDARFFPVLTMDEVERLEREQATLNNRLESATRKLAIEGKVREASSSLVRLHANNNQRLSRQAENQLTEATRKVDELATDVWRLQRRNGAIKHQLLEHAAGVMARCIGRQDNLHPGRARRLEDVATDFDSSHLYPDMAGGFGEHSIHMSPVPNLQLSSRTLEELLQTPDLSDAHSLFADRLTELNNRLRQATDQLRDWLGLSRSAGDGADDVYRDERAHLERQCSILETTVQQVTRTQITLSSQSAEERELASLVGISNEDRGLARVISRVRALLDENHQQCMQIRETKARRQSLLEAHDKSNATLLAHHSQALDDLSREHDDACRALSISHNSIVKDLEDAVRQTGIARKDLEEKLEALARDREMFSSQCDALQMENNILKSGESDLLGRLGVLSTESQRRCGHLMEQLADLRKRHESALEDSNLRETALRKELDHGALQQIETEKALEQAQVSIGSLRQKLSRADATADEASRSTLAQQHKRAVDELAQARVERDRLLKAIQSLETNCAQDRAMLDALSARNVELEMQLDDLRLELMARQGTTTPCRSATHEDVDLSPLVYASTDAQAAANLRRGFRGMLKELRAEYTRQLSVKQNVINQLRGDLTRLQTARNSERMPRDSCADKASELLQEVSPRTSLA
ncbi:hypothetical protein PYCC9005_004186 [Savitreella phatthalungensis]